ncbi:5-formyltetrahydrofolate cyclo-ligase [Ruicaihuangia caeni]|uniref:5-formyltetrahydrofolate cyclo-ligase n=1 Tax=Ruicaihuangia caeni TaxID=3042517 RepID=A0AAW6T9V0_9MICO|nr:5-formyltetrahydrofolate cyclo-ligase [Klugiella sp. YN-L-19]MDI2098798.1 5-formyltetrahydrofolate cyclo-ligase [Klugiella sp. YN-L-19]
MSQDPSHAKRALRAELRERRRIMTAREREQATAGITRNLIDLSTRLGVKHASAYLSASDEPDTRPFLRWASEHGIRVLLPISRNDGLLDWAPFDDGVEDADIFGMPAPTTEVLSPMAINEVDLIIVPAAAIDRSGMRMGWGRGYFDKTLGSMDQRPPSYAVVFDNEVVERVPTELHDQAVDGVVTPSEIITF